MKKIILSLLISNVAFAQVAVGKTSVSPSAILEFPTTSGNTKGIILPAVVNTANMTSATPGTIVFDIATLKVKYNAGFWQDLTDFTGAAPLLTPGLDLPNAKVVIGDQNTTAEGVLVLDAPDKALILPYITNPASNVKSPVAGMICYDPTKKMMCVYNGNQWFYWD